jgi:hypothetical protein
MDDFTTRVWDQLVGRLDGPMFFRFALQPLMAAFLAWRAGLADARAHRAPYLWHALSEPDDRPQLLRDGWKDVGKVFVIALVLDCIYQLIVFRWIYPVQALLVAILLAIVPYAMLRGPATRITRRWQMSH